MAVVKVKVDFDPEFEGTLYTERGEAALGSEKGDLQPYDMLLGGLASCYYATFLGIVEKKRLSFTGVEIEVTGVKRDEVPATLKTVDMKFTVKGAEEKDYNGFKQAADLAGKYCSIHVTISKVAEINTELIFA